MNQLVVLSDIFDEVPPAQRGHKSWLKFGARIEAKLTEWYGATVDVEALHEISLEIARNYQDQTISYDIADSLMNCLWSVFLEKTKDLPSPFWDVFQAFDAGEFHRAADKSDGPIKEHTNPMIDNILRRVSEGKMS